MCFQGKINVFRYNRGTWEPTLFNLATHKVCNVIFDKNSYWYKWWFQYIANQEEIKEKCIIMKDVGIVTCCYSVKRLILISDCFGAQSFRCEVGFRQYFRSASSRTIQGSDHMGTIRPE